MSKVRVGIGALASFLLNVGINIGASTGHFKNLEWAATPLLVIGSALGAWWLIWTIRDFLKSPDARSPQPRHDSTQPLSHIENKPETHIENKPVFENKPIFENKPTIILHTGMASAPVADTSEIDNKAYELLRQRRPSGCIVQDISTALGIGFQEAEQILLRLVKNRMAYRRPIDVAGDFFYFYRGPD
jgi:hypothetical protein